MHIMFETSMIIARTGQGKKAPGDGKTWNYSEVNYGDITH